MTRVLLGELGPLVRAGLEDMMRAEQLELVSASGSLVDRVLVTLPDVVVLDQDADQDADLAREIATRFPAVTVLACSSRRPAVRVFPPFHRGESYVRSLDGSLKAVLPE